MRTVRILRPREESRLPPGISRRVVMNLVVLGLMGIALAVWAVTNVLSLDAITRPYAISGNFTTASGAEPRFEVAYLGIEVGSISAVTLKGNHVVVDMKINRGTQLPVGLTAAIDRESAVGEPFVNLSPPNGYRGNGPYVHSGYVIPERATTVPVSYKAVFAALGRLIQAVPPEAVGSLVHTLAVGLAGRGNDVRQILENTDALTTSLAKNSATIDQTINDLTTLSATLANHSSAINTSLNNLALLTNSLSQSRQEINTLLTAVPGFTGTLATILNASDSSLGCVLDGLGVISSTISTPNELAALEAVLDSAPGMATALIGTTATSPIGDFFHGSAILNLNGPAIPLYPTPKVLPAVPSVPACPAAATVNATVPLEGTGTGGHSGVTAGVVPIPRVGTHKTLTNQHSPTKGTPSSLQDLLAIGVAAILLLLLASVVFRPWRFLTSRRSPPSAQ